MIIVYGTRSGESNKRLPHACGNCQQPALLQTDWYRYFHIMFVPTFPVGKQRSVQCQACGNSFDAKGSAPIWTFAGAVILAFFFLGGAAHQAIRRFGILDNYSAANIASATSDPATSASAPAPSAAAPAPTHAAAAHAPAAATTTTASADGGVAVTSNAAPGKRGKKKKK